MANFRRKHTRGRFTRNRSCPHCYPKTWVGIKVDSKHNAVLQVVRSVEAVKEFFLMS